MMTSIKIWDHDSHLLRFHVDGGSRLVILNRSTRCAASHILRHLDRRFVPFATVLQQCTRYFNCRTVDLCDRARRFLGSLILPLYFRRLRTDYSCSLNLHHRGPILLLTRTRDGRQSFSRFHLGRRYNVVMAGFQEHWVFWILRRIPWHFGCVRLRWFNVSARGCRSAWLDKVHLQRP